MPFIALLNYINSTWFDISAGKHHSHLQLVWNVASTSTKQHMCTVFSAIECLHTICSQLLNSIVQVAVFLATVMNCNVKGISQNNTLADHLLHHDSVWTAVTQVTRLRVSHYVGIIILQIPVFMFWITDAKSYDANCQQLFVISAVTMPAMVSVTSAQMMP